MSIADAGLTVAHLDAMPDDGRRHELIGGAIVMTPAPGAPHQRVSRRLVQLLEAAQPPGYEVFDAPLDIDLPDGSRVQPDVLVAPQSSVVGERVVLPLLMVVEIVSDGSRHNDRVTKRVAYAEAGIPAYWLIDLLDSQVTCLRLAEATGDYEPYGTGPRVNVDWPVAATLDVESLAAPPRAPS